MVIRLVQNHYFVDGNKRVALATMLNFLNSNGCNWEKVSNDFFYSLIILIARKGNGDLDQEIDKQLRKIVNCK